MQTVPRSQSMHWCLNSKIPYILCDTVRYDWLRDCFNMGINVLNNRKWRDTHNVTGSQNHNPQLLNKLLIHNWAHQKHKSTLKEWFVCYHFICMNYSCPNWQIDKLTDKSLTQRYFELSCIACLGISCHLGSPLNSCMNDYIQ